MRILYSKLKLLIGSLAAPNIGRAASKLVRRRQQQKLDDSSGRWRGPKAKAKRMRAAFYPMSVCAGRGKRSAACMMTESFRVYHQVELHLQDDDDVLRLSSRREYNIIDYGGGSTQAPGGVGGSTLFYTAPPSPSTISCSSTITSTTTVVRNDVEFYPESLFSAADAEAMATYSSNPRCDFVRSMREMMQALRPTQVEELEALLECYLRLNAPTHHATIALAFLSALASPAA
ncbi:hypothetical protein GOP47_0002424 [Adiantum capillus-veneris]|uniref:Transcription repressor n=1 Tax=Adiantum capillus-veneris TaxID=13818 RepID=A0A9D4VA31_ADICA|nr:hypothetical protein GOP47_0002424 [Adiantum capillus-veneris]